MKILFFLTFLFFLLALASAQIIKIGIKMDLKGNISALFYNTSNGVLRIDPEFYNTGSVAYKARARLDVMNSTDVIFTGWSKEETLTPGERKNFEIFYYTPKTLENVTARIRIYYGFELAEQKIELKIENKQTPEDVLRIKNFRTYEDHIKFQLRSSKALKNILIIPKGYIASWIFEQRKIEAVEGNKNVEVTLAYEAPFWLSHDINIEAVSEDGTHHSARSFSLQKEEGILKYLNYLTDWLSLALNL